MRDNETIFQLIAETESFVKARLIGVIEAEAHPDTIRAFVDCLTAMQCAVNNLGGQRFDAPIPSSGFGDSNAIYAIAREVFAPFEKRLEQLHEQLEGCLEGGDTGFACTGKRHD